MTNKALQILHIIQQHSGIKAKDICHYMSLTKREINSIIYSELKDYCYQDSLYQWHSRTNQLPELPTENSLFDEITDDRHDEVIVINGKVSKILDESLLASIETHLENNKLEAIKILNDHFSTRTDVNMNLKDWSELISTLY